MDRIPRRYTVEAGKSLVDAWDLSKDNGAYQLEIFGPNGYFRSYSGNINGFEPEILVGYDHEKGGVTLTVQNAATKQISIQVNSNAYAGYKSAKMKIASGSKSDKMWTLAKSGNWYDFTLKFEGHPQYERRFAGRVETGKDSVSDPAMGFEI